MNYKHPSLRKMFLCSILLLSAFAARAQYCTTGLYITACFDDDYIQGFTTNGGTTTISNPSSGCNGGGSGYTYFSTQSHTTFAGGNVHFTIQNNYFYGEYYKMWVDWNADGDFTDVGEQVYSDTLSSAEMFIGLFAVPASATPGTKRLRVRCVFDATPFTACSQEDYGEIEDYNLVITTPGGSCGAPTGTTVSSVTAFSATVGWNNVTGALGYEGFLSPSSIPPPFGLFTNTNPATIQFLTPNTTYYAHLRTICAGGFSSWTTISFTTLPAPPCNAPTGISITGVTATTATISWNPVLGATAYEVDVTNSPTPPVWGFPTPGTTITPTFLTPATTYYVHVRTECNNGMNHSGWVTQSFTTPALPPCNAPTGLTVSSVTSTGAGLTWNTVAGATGYNYEITTSSIPPSFPSYTSVPSVYVPWLSPSTTYYAHVRTECNNGLNYSSWVTQQFTTSAPSPCNAPTGFVASSITNTTAQFNWNIVSTATAYEGAVSTSPIPPVSGSYLTGNSASANALLPGTLYYAHVRTECDFGLNYSSWTTVSFTTTGGAPCSAPGGVAVSNITSSSAAVNWNAVPGAVNYQYAVNTSASGPASGSIAAATNVSLSGLNPGSSYYAHIRAHCGGGVYSTWSSQPLFTQFAASAGSIAKESLAVKVYPNPATDKVYIEATGAIANDATVFVMDMAGKVLANARMLDSKAQVDITVLAAGMYTIRYTDAHSVRTIKFNKQ